MLQYEGMYEYAVIDFSWWHWYVCDQQDASVGNAYSYTYWMDSSGEFHTCNAVVREKQHMIIFIYNVYIVYLFKYVFIFW